MVAIRAQFPSSRGGGSAMEGHHGQQAPLKHLASVLHFKPLYEIEASRIARRGRFYVAEALDEIAVLHDDRYNRVLRTCPTRLLSFVALGCFIVNFWTTVFVRFQGRCDTVRDILMAVQFGCGASGVSGM